MSPNVKAVCIVAVVLLGGLVAYNYFKKKSAVTVTAPEIPTT